MRRLMIAAALAVASLGLSGCDPGGVESASSRPAVDEQAITLAFGAAEEVTTLVANLRKVGSPCCIPGTPAARDLADKLDSAAQYLEAASAAQKLGNQSLARINLDEAWGLIRMVRNIVSPPEPRTPRGVEVP